MATPHKIVLQPREQKAYEYACAQTKANTAELQSVNLAASIVFVVLAEQEAIDPVTAGEHIVLFSQWGSGVDYTTGNIRQYEDKLYRCLQTHTSQVDWTPDTVPALWKQIADPTVEWPIWSQPVCAQDAYQIDDKVSYSGRKWVSQVDSNVWVPGNPGTEALWREWVSEDMLESDET